MNSCCREAVLDLTAKTHGVLRVGDYFFRFRMLLLDTPGDTSTSHPTIEKRNLWTKASDNKWTKSFSHFEKK